MGDFDGHTPGPWRVFSDDGKIRAGVSGGFEPFGGCGCCGSPWVNGEDRSEQEANARLIAAAPDLLAERDRLRAEVERLRAEKGQFLTIAIEMGDILAEAAKARGVNFPHLDEARASLARAALAEKEGGE